MNPKQARCHATPGFFCWVGATNLDVGEPGIIRRPRKPDHAGSNPAIQTENGRASQLATAPGLNPDERSALRVRLPLLPLCDVSAETRVRGRAAQASVFQTGQAGSTPAGHFDRVFFDNTADDYGPVGNRQTTLFEKEGCWGFNSPLGHSICPGGPVRSGRHSLTVKSMGSNPMQGTSSIRPSPLGGEGVRGIVSAGHRRAQVAVTHPQSLCRFNSCPTHFRGQRPCSSTGGAPVS